jgi:predicted NBD/HSP70 family sugar kinase
MSAIIGVDVGSTTMSGGLVTAEGEILAVIQVPTPRKGSGSALDSLGEVVGRLQSDASARGLALLGVGVGLPGLVDPEKGMMRSSENYVPEFHEVPLADRLAAQTGLPAFVDNDVNALALAEWTFGLGRGATSLVLLAIGTGVGGGMVLNSELVRGSRGYAGEFGHMTVNFRGPLCVCGGRGCMAAYLCGTQIADQARTLFHRRAAGRDPGAFTTAMVFEAAAAGDRFATRIVDEACEALAAGLGAIVNAFNPQVLVVTGGVAKSLAPLQTDILRRTASYALEPVLAETRIAIVPSDKRETVRGGAALVLYELSRREQLVATGSDLHDAREG